MRIIKFEGPNCTYCKKLDKIIETLSICTQIEHVNVTENLDLARQYNVSTLPTLVKIEDSGNTTILAGMQDIKKLKEFFSEA